MRCGVAGVAGVLGLQRIVGGEVQRGGVAGDVGVAGRVNRDPLPGVPFRAAAAEVGGVGERHRRVEHQRPVVVIGAEPDRYPPAREHVAAGDRPAPAAGQLVRTRRELAHRAPSARGEDQVASLVEPQAALAPVAEPDLARIGARRDVKHVLELVSRAGEGRVDPGPHPPVGGTGEGRDVGLPAVAVVADQVVHPPWKLAAGGQPHPRALAQETDRHGAHRHPRRPLTAPSPRARDYRPGHAPPTGRGAAVVKKRQHRAAVGQAEHVPGAMGDQPHPRVGLAPVRRKGQRQPAIGPRQDDHESRPKDHAHGPDKSRPPAAPCPD